MPRKKHIAALIFTLFLICSVLHYPKKQKCGQPPDNLTLKYSNSWQTQKTPDGTLYLLSAYLDDREYLIQKYFTIRILGMFHRKSTFFCQIWYDSEPPVIVKSDFFWIWKKDWEQVAFYQPYLISCDTRDSRVPTSVSLVRNKCDQATNRLEIRYEKVTERHNFVVCVKGLNFPYEDKSTRLIEWMELLTLLGAEKVHFYQFSVHANVQKLLNYYKKQNRIDVTLLTLVGEHSNLPPLQNKFLKKKKVERRLQEVLPFNDCLYKYLYKYKYIVSLDIDEVIVPQNGTWLDLMTDLRNRNMSDSYLARNVYFFDQFVHNSSEIPTYMHILNHVTRARQYSNPDKYVKGFHDTEKVLALYNHISLWCLERWECNNHNIDVGLAQLQHYRGNCVKELKNCDSLRNDTIEDARVWRFRDALIPRVKEVMTDLEDA